MIPGGLRPGLLISITGHPSAGAKRFEVNFVVGQTIDPYNGLNSDIAFHFNPRFSQKQVIRNARQIMIWGKEEVLPHHMPLTVGSPFELLFLIEQTGFKVAVNGKHFIEFKHRIPLTAANLLHVTGDVVLDRISFHSEPAFPVNSITPAKLEAAFPEITTYHPVVPFSHKFPQSGPTAGLNLFISGRPNLAFDRFQIDFLSDKKDILFHFNPRNREKSVIRNSRTAGVWGPEERSSPTFPFAAGVNFDMMVRFESRTFLVAVNGQHFVSFAARPEGAVADVREMCIEGDVVITSIRIAV